MSVTRAAQSMMMHPGIPAGWGKDQRDTTNNIKKVVADIIYE